MIITNNIKGAEWRKWDLHFHTQSSYDYKNKSITDQTIIDTLIQNNIEVVAITDHHIIDTVRIRNLQKLGQGKITVLPGIEFRAELGGSESIHFIGIFSEKSNIEDIWIKLQSGCEITASDIARIGGDKNIHCDLKETSALIHKLGGLVTVHAGAKTNTIENITNSVSFKMALKTDLVINHIDILELGKKEDINDYNNKVFPAIKTVLPMIICSDNHKITEYELKDNCWVKADPSFLGLKQIINEPEERVFIGEQPEVLKRIDLNRTKYIKELSISKEDGYSGNDGIWFNDITIPLNSELVAIIGNKGSGKSAIADIVSLCSNYHDNNDFSFLSNKKFREKNGRIAKNFNATIVWQSGQKKFRNLNDTPDSSEIKNVKYIPQGQFENLTNEISNATEFQKEIEKVVFSHIDDTEKLGAQTFSELVEKKTKIVEIEQDALYGKIKNINEEILKLEDKETKIYADELAKKLKQKEDELTSLIEPIIVANPNDDPTKKQESQELNDKIGKIQKKINLLSRLKSIKESLKKSRLISLKNLKDTKSEIELKIQEFSEFLQSKKKMLAGLNIDIDTVVELKSDFSNLNKLISNQELQLESIKISLGEKKQEDDNSSIPKLIDDENAKLESETKKLNDEQNKYQSYLTAKKIWTDSCKKITGDKNTTNTIEFYKAEIEYINSQLTIELKSKHKERKETVIRIFKNKQSVIEVYKEIKDKLSQIISENSDTLKNYKIEVDASLIKKSDFNNRFLSNIQQNKAGTYFSKEGAEKQLAEIISNVDFDNEDSIMAFLDSIVESLKIDQRDGNSGVKRAMKDQVKDIITLYNYIFNLEFLDYKYQLKQGSKEIDQLSPGERGALLLVFYLLLDKDDIPLIIDQPEDNLDNESVATILVPFIRAAKKKRQIILVTHNPNLAVVADAEQVIYVDLDKENNYTFSVVSGSIENIVVNDKIVKVLEGAMPAFKKRKQKYYDN